MSKLLSNNAFCTILIIVANAILISAVVITTRVVGDYGLLIYRTLYIVLLLGNLLIRYVIKEGSKTLSKYYLFILVGLTILFYPLGKIIF